VSAHVVTNYQGRSRGFGFVEFDEKDQKAAFDATNLNKIVANNRPLTVKIALVEEKQNPAETPEGEASSQPATQAPAQQ
jgi:RNA recognition motif-containing protein